MTEIENRINALVTNFISEVSRLAQAAALETLKAALGGATAPVVRDIRVGKAAKPAASATGGAAAAAAKRAKGEKRPKAEIAQVQDKVLAHIRANPGQRIEQINKVLGTRTSDLTLPLKKLAWLAWKPPRPLPKLPSRPKKRSNPSFCQRKTGLLPRFFMTAAIQKMTTVKSDGTLLQLLQQGTQNLARRVLFFTSRRFTTDRYLAQAGLVAHLDTIAPD